MPTYVYKFVDTGETIEVQQGFHDATLTEIVHPGSGEPKAVKKVFTPVGVTFKGSGFFKTDNRGKSASSTATPSSGSSGSDSSGDSAPAATPTAPSSSESGSSSSASTTATSTSGTTPS